MICFSFKAYSYLDPGLHDEFIKFFLGVFVDLWGLIRGLFGFHVGGYLEGSIWSNNVIVPVNLGKGG